MTIAKAIARAWSDAAFKDKLMNDTRAALADVGVNIPAGVIVKVMENTADTVHLVLPVPPASATALDQSELEEIAGGLRVADLPFAAVAQ